MSWTARGSNLSGEEIFSTGTDWP